MSYKGEAYETHCNFFAVLSAGRLCPDCKFARFNASVLCAAGSQSNSIAPAGSYARANLDA